MEGESRELLEVSPQKDKSVKQAQETCRYVTGVAEQGAWGSWGAVVVHESLSVSRQVISTVPCSQHSTH